MELEWIKTYTQTEISKKDKIDRRKVGKFIDKYIPIFVANWQSSLRFKKGKQELPYMVRYIRRKDLDKYLENVKKTDTQWERKARNRESLRTN